MRLESGSRSAERMVFPEMVNVASFLTGSGSVSCDLLFPQDTHDGKDNEKEGRKKRRRKKEKKKTCGRRKIRTPETTLEDPMHLENYFSFVCVFVCQRVCMYSCFFFFSLLSRIDLAGCCLPLIVVSLTDSLKDKSPKDLLFY